MTEKKRTILGLLIVLGVVSATAWAQPHLSGAISGPLGPGSYIVDGNITIAATATVTVAPGTTFLHSGYYNWMISGTLIANGTVTDSIKFRRQNPVPEHLWGGLRFTPTLPMQNSLDYCLIQDVQNGTSSGGAEILGGAIYIMGNYLHVNHSRIYGCRVGHDGAGIYAYYATALVVENTLIDSCMADIGGGIYLSTCNGAQIKNNTITRNRSIGT
jgi:hypothetical protein